MHPRNLVRLGGGLLAIAGLFLTVQALAQRQTSQSRGSLSQAERASSPTVRFRGHLGNELLQSRIESLRQALAGERASSPAAAARTVQSSGEAEGVELLAESTHVAIARPTEEGTFEVICEESPARARATLTGSSERQR